MNRRVAAVALLSIAIAALVAANGSAPTSAAPSSCQPFGDAGPAERSVEADRESGAELTLYFNDGSYQVTRCDARGRIEMQQLVGPVEIPGGKTAMLPLASLRREGDVLEGQFALYGDPDESAWAAAWEKYGAGTQAKVLPPTDEVRE